MIAFTEAKSHKMQLPSHDQPHCTNSENSSEVLRRIKRKIEDVTGEDQSGFRKGKGTTDIIGMLKIIPQRSLDIDEELCANFIDQQ
jgi:hypothetical protein